MLDVSTTVGVARSTLTILQDFKSLQDIVGILGMDELSEEEKLTPLFVAEMFTSSRPPSRISTSCSQAHVMTVQRLPSTWSACWRT